MTLQWMRRLTLSPTRKCAERLEVVTENPPVSPTPSGRQALLRYDWEDLGKGTFAVRNKELRGFRLRGLGAGFSGAHVPEKAIVDPRRVTTWRVIHEKATVAASGIRLAAQGLQDPDLH